MSLHTLAFIVLALAVGLMLADVMFMGRIWGIVRRLDDERRRSAVADNVERLKGLFETPYVVVRRHLSTGTFELLTDPVRSYDEAMELRDRIGRDDDTVWVYTMINLPPGAKKGHVIRENPAGFLPRGD